MKEYTMFLGTVARTTAVVSAASVGIGESRNKTITPHKKRTFPLLIGSPFGLTFDLSIYNKQDWTLSPIA